MLDPAILRKVLLKLLLRPGHGQALRTKHYRAARRGALIDGKQITAHNMLLMRSWLAVAYGPRCPLLCLLAVVFIRRRLIATANIGPLSLS